MVYRWRKRPVDQRYQKQSYTDMSGFLQNAKAIQWRNDFQHMVLVTRIPGRIVDKNPAASARDTGLIPGPGRFCMQSNSGCAPQFLGPHAELLEPAALGPTSCSYWAFVLRLLNPTFPRVHTPQLLSLNAATTELCGLQQEKTPQWEACVLQ